MQSVSHPLVTALVPHPFSTVAFGNGNSPADYPVSNSLLQFPCAQRDHQTSGKWKMVQYQERNRHLAFRHQWVSGGFWAKKEGRNGRLPDYPTGPTLNAVCPSNWSPAVLKGWLSPWVSLGISFGPRALEGLRTQHMNSGQPQIP